MGDGKVDFCCQRENKLFAMHYVPVAKIVTTLKRCVPTAGKRTGKMDGTVEDETEVNIRNWKIAGVRSKK